MKNELKKDVSFLIGPDVTNHVSPDLVVSNEFEPNVRLDRPMEDCDPFDISVYDLDHLITALQYFREEYKHLLYKVE